MAWGFGLVLSVSSAYLMLELAEIMSQAGVARASLNINQDSKLGECGRKHGPCHIRSLEWSSLANPILHSMGLARATFLDRILRPRE